MKSAPFAELLLAIVLCHPPAAMGAAESWLPPDTLAVLSVPDLAAARHQFSSNAWVQLWHSQPMTPFRSNLLHQLDLGTLTHPSPETLKHLGKLAGLAQGQFLLALTLTDSSPTSLGQLQLLAAANLGNRTPEAEVLLASLPPANPTNAEAAPRFIENVAFRPIALSWPPLLWPNSAARRSTAEPCWIGITNSWLLLGSDAEELSRLLTRMTGATDADPPPTSRFAEFVSRQPITGYAWLNLQPLITFVLAQADAYDQTTQASDGIPMPKRRVMLESSGVTALQSLALAVRESPDGTQLDLELTVPAATRRGLIEMIELRPADASPPPDVPLQVLWFERTRLDFNKSWSAFERLIIGLFPQAKNVLDLLFQSAGPASQENDLRKQLLAALGDDVVRCGFAPDTPQLSALHRAPSYTRLASTNALQLALSLKALTVLLPPPLSDLTQQNFMGREIYSLPLTTASTPPHTLNFTVLGESVVFTTDAPLLRSLLAPSTATNPPLNSRPGLAEAATRVGGTEQGLFGYVDTAQAARWTFEALRKETNAWSQLLGLVPFNLASRAGLDRFANHLDFTLLPPFEAVAPHFTYSVHAAGSDDRRLFLRVYLPR